MKREAVLQRITFILLMVNCLQSQGANLIWSDPIPISEGTDICTMWSLDRAYGLGLNSPVTVNGVAFVPFNCPSRGEGSSLPASIREGETEIAVSGDGDGVFTGQKYFYEGGPDFPQDYRTLLDSGLSDNGSACTLTLTGLTIGKTYLLQVWVNDSKNSSASEFLGGGNSISANVRFNTIVTYGGVGQYIIGIFVADEDQQPITFTSANGALLINAFQLREAPENVKLVIIKQPIPTANYSGKTCKMSVLAVGKAPLAYQWQRIVNGSVRNIYDNDKFSGGTNNEITIRNMTSHDAGDYRVLVRNEAGSVNSGLVDVSVLPQPAEQLINVDVNDGPSATYTGDGVLVGNIGLDVWNGIDGRKGFTNVVLFDSTGAETPVSLTLSKPREDGYTRKEIQNDLLKDYSPAPDQTVTLHNLEPNCYYDLLAYSIGSVANEGGAFSGALEGVVYGGSVEGDFWVSRFIPGTNYIQNPFARSDATGTLRFIIKATASIFKGGFYNGDFNGLQIVKIASNSPPPFISQQPRSLSAYGSHKVTLTVNALVPPPYQLTYQWQRISASGVRNLSDADNVRGATSRVLTIPNLTSSAIGNYRVIVGGTSTFTTSHVASVSITQAPNLINVDVKNDVDPSPPYDGEGVLASSAGHFWNGINGRAGFKDIPLLDNVGKPTVVTLSLIKDQVDSYTSPLGANNMLKDYSVGHSQTIILKNLEPDSHYHLVVYSIGAVENEGGVFSGAITGIVHGWNQSSDGVVNTFVRGTNYIENVAALSDGNGSLTLTIQPTSTVTPAGFRNSDFNGLQIMPAK